MNLVLLGLNHKSAPVDVREKLAFDKGQLSETVRQLKNRPSIAETVIISTCNRVEMYASVSDAEKGLASLKEFIYEYHNISKENLDHHFYQYSSEDVVDHLFKVSSSLDSMVVGEAQILGQVKEAYAFAKELKSTGTILNQLFEKAFTAAKRVRTETKIAESAVSISFAAVELGKKIFGDIQDKIIMIIGAGEMAELAAQHLKGNGVKGVLVCNRTYERAVELSRKLEGSAIRYSDIEDELVRTDIVICSAGAPNFIITREMMARLIHHRKNKPMFLIDIAVPRTIEPGINDMENVYLYDVDDMQNVVDANRKIREREALKAEAIVDREVNRFLSWLDTLEVSPTITALRSSAESIRIREMEKTLSKIGPVSDEIRLGMDKMTSAIMNSFLHSPTVCLKKKVGHEDGHQYVKVVRNLFRLDEKNERKN